ncbi:hypothetical protein AYM40_06705 [Paraburkholderia phytofirmans OLGA172]|uniref:HTH araC/xylS-type domain-containing protein n=1 Tax=Paraburkholderia phytofirmans OLGA172 TaxID=1417228 RepID=A0A160FJI0_9BURK|nr:AraC family transcriptional regulator [Paraburkholderia phytofirmans]ANB72096.1 hypothetical protein AYM40_06705 [Paraburkholderia phytofirmans OLGA172]
MPTFVRASGLRGYVDLMRSLGEDPTNLLRRFRISLEQLEDEDALLRLRSVVQLLEESATATQCDDFGLRLSHNQDITVLGQVAVVVQSAATVREALNLIKQYLFIHSPGIRLSINEKSRLVDHAVEASLEIQLERPTAHRQTIDLALADFYQMVVLLNNGSQGILGVALPHKPHAAESIYRQFFGCKVSFEQPIAGLHLERSMLNKRLSSTNHAIREIAEEYLRNRYGTPGDTVSHQVRQLLSRTLGAAHRNKEDVAQMLAIHPRTLQRRLEDEGTSFEVVRDEVRREEMLRYLVETEISLGRVTEILGYSEQSAMTRACSRWFGTSPAALRRSKIKHAKVRRQRG